MGATEVRGSSLQLAASWSPRVHTDLFLRRRREHQPFHRCLPCHRRLLHASHDLHSKSHEQKSMSLCSFISRGLQAPASCVTMSNLHRRSSRQLAASQTCAQGVLRAPAAGIKRRTGSEFWGVQVRPKYLRRTSSFPEAQLCMTLASASHAHSCTGRWDAWTAPRALSATCALQVRRSAGRRASSMLCDFAVSSAGWSSVPSLQKLLAAAR